MTSQEIRQQYLDFFKSKNHLIVPSAPIVLKDDPTLMFSNSGMTQFKDSFLGYKEPKSVRIADTQKCLRVSGKHNDLDDVGKDTYHHTMFEMLGNWSFGDYFKEEAIAWAWELLTEVYKIPKDWLYVTVFEGDTKENLERDNDAFSYWKEFISEDRILNGNKKDNFWEMGEQGPCGPCSEIHIDIRPINEKQKIDGKTLVNNDHPQVIEIWNLVFMEYLRKADGTLEFLPKKNIDTGMGFERLCMVLQGKISNYDTDVFSPLIQKVETISGFNYGNNLENDIAFRVIVDHIRAVAFTIADGQLPSNNGAGYVIRRILRRAISYAYRFLNLKEPFLYQLVDILEQQMGTFFPEITKQKSLVKDVIKEEEHNFLRTIALGLQRLNELIEKSKETKILNGKELFVLYDTYGFPLDLSRIIGEEQGFSVDEQGFETEMNIQKNRGKEAAKQTTSDWTILIDNAEEKFVGYDELFTSSKITKYRQIQNNKGTFYQIVLDQTPFYAESGGQVGDTGFLISTNDKVKILNTLKENNLIIHITENLPENISSEFTAQVEQGRRKAIMKNHTATHLLHQALREKLGKHVEQKGSYVGADNLRFDFSHFQKMNNEEISWVEDFVNQRIADEITLIENRTENLQNAISKGAMALFGEKYGDVVRTIQFGNSIELCGGTHVKNTSEIQWFKILTESSSAAGIRRIEAITGEAVQKHYQNIENQLNKILELFKNPKEPITHLEKFIQENNSIRKQIEELQKQKAQSEKELWKQSSKEINGINTIIVSTELEPNLIKDLAFQLRTEIDNLVLIVASNSNEKPSISVCLSDNLLSQKNLNAINIVRELAKYIDGNGGGQAHFAMAGGKNAQGITQALEQGKLLISSLKIVLF